MRPDRASNLPDWSAVRKVLLIRLRSIGDTVLMTPCLAALKALHTEIKITVVSEPLAAPVVGRLIRTQRTPMAHLRFAACLQTK